MKIFLLFSLIAVVICNELQADEKSVESARGITGDPTYYYEGCLDYWGYCGVSGTKCDCCYKNMACINNRCRDTMRKGFCREKQKECASYSTMDYKCDFN
nr:venom protein [Lampona murina]